MKMTRQFLMMTAVFGALTTSCGSVQSPLQGENYGNLLATAGGLVLDQSKHETGWTKPNCNLCHNFNNIHLNDNTGTGIDMAAIRTIVYDDGLSSCATCHGTNGVP
jgi:hypothetical protein